MDWVFLHEGGYAERDSEPGGAVNMGISFTAYQDWWEQVGPGVGNSILPTYEDLKGLSREDAERIYTHFYFGKIRFDQLPAGVDYALVDFAVNSGVGGALRSVQRRLRFVETGTMKTNVKDAPFFWALRNRPPKEVIDAIQEARLRVMQSSRKWERFKGNWTNRLAVVKTRAYSLAGIDDD
jgi:lysozyme family protein